MSADLYAATTARIIEALEQGTPPWVRPWSTIPDAMPMNAQSRRPYRGINFTLLSLVAEQHGYAGQPLADLPPGAGPWRPRPQGRAGHADRVLAAAPHRRGVGRLPRARRRPTGAAREGVPAVAQLHRLQCRANRGPGSAHTPSRACAPGCRKRKPRSCCSCRALGSGWEARERSTSRPATRSTCPHRRHSPTRRATTTSRCTNSRIGRGHPARCNRDLTGRFGDSSYAVEELIAELGAAYLCAHCRIDGELRHAGYIASWLKVLRGDKRAIFTAAAQAQRAADYVLRLAQPPEREAMAA